MSDQPSLHIEFQDAIEDVVGSQPPLYTTSRSIKGRLQIVNCPDDAFIVKMTFYGNICNRVSFPSNYRVKPPDVTFNHVTYECAIVQEPSSFSTTTENNSHVRAVPFVFPLDRRFLRRVEDDAPQSDDLFPPSLRVNSIKYGQRGASCHVFYAVKASIIREDLKPITTKREVRIFDETPTPSPPAYVDKFGAEFIHEQSKSLKKKLGASGRLSISISEPAPIEIGDIADHEVTRIPLRLILDSASFSSIQKSWNISLDWALQASTFISTVPMQSNPTLEKARKSVFMRHAESTIDYGSRKMTLSGWYQPYTAGEGRKWMLDTTLLLDLVPKSLVPPTYSSRYLWRQYSITLLMRVSGDGTNTFDFDIPVQINFPTNHTALRRPSSPSSMCSLPQYVK